MMRVRVLITILAVALCASDGAADQGYVQADSLLRDIEAGKAPVIIDVRSPEEYARSHIPGALLMPIQAFPGIIGQLPGDRRQSIIVYCEMGPRAGLAKAALSIAGYTNVSYVEGHMKGWRESRLRTSK